MNTEDKRAEIRRKILERKATRGVHAVSPPSGAQSNASTSITPNVKRITLVRHELPCIHEGATTEYCKSCHGPSAEWRHVRSCDIHEQCTRGFVSHRVKACDRCPDYQADGVPNGINVGQSIGPKSVIVPQNPNILSNPQSPKNPPQPQPRPVKIPLVRNISPTSTQNGTRIPVRSVRLQPGVRIRPHIRGPAISRMEGTRKPKDKVLTWAYGVTTVPQRRKDLLPRTLLSLKKSGFPNPHLFIDGDWDYQSWNAEFGLGCTMRYPRIRVFGNWMLSLGELYIRQPKADFYAIFQDDFVTGLNLRQYLEKGLFPEKGYLNLYTFPENQARTLSEPGWYRSNQGGKGAVALVFSLAGVKLLLAHNHMVSRPPDPVRGHKFVDGGIVDTMKKCGWAEYIHNPSLVQHTGKASSHGNYPQPLAPSFKGEDFDFLTLLPSQVHDE